jgi:hypothetical protein
MRPIVAVLALSALVGACSQPDPEPAPAPAPAAPAAVPATPAAAAEPAAPARPETAEERRQRLQVESAQRQFEAGMAQGTIVVTPAPEPKKN